MKNSKFDNLIISTTDTVIGLGGRVSENTKKLIFEVKRRDPNKKLIILVSSIEQARKFSEWNQKAEELAKKYWPGATTIVVNNQGFRMPNQLKLLEYLESNGPIYMTSCNISNEPVCDSIEKAKKTFPEIKNVYNFGKMSQKPSKIIRAEDNKILREG